MCWCFWSYKSIHFFFCVVELDRVRKIKLSSQPASVIDLIEILKDQLQLDCDFNLQYEDPDFDGKLTGLENINELPNKSCVHISPTQDSSSVASTDILSDFSPPERLSRWPASPFQIQTCFWCWVDTQRCKFWIWKDWKTFSIIKGPETSHFITCHRLSAVSPQWQGDSCGSWGTHKEAAMS